MIKTNEEYENCKSQVIRQLEEIAELQATVAAVQAEIDVYEVQL